VVVSGHAFNRPYKFDRTTEEQGVIKRQRYERRKPDVVRRAVCTKCNNGWMNRLDQLAQPMLTAMIKGTPLSIADVSTKTTLAAWVSKVSLIVDSMQETEASLAPGHARYLCQRATPAARLADLVSRDGSIP
jgi:hypothetical protein